MSLVHTAALLFCHMTKSQHTDARLKTCSPSVVLLLFLLMNATLPGLLSSDASTELLLITLSSSFFPVTSAPTAATAAAASSSSSSSWSEYWLKASTSSLKISSLINPPSGKQLTCQNLTSNSFSIYLFHSRNAKAAASSAYNKTKFLSECCSDVQYERGWIMGSRKTSQRDKAFNTHLCHHGHHRSCR